MVCVCLKLYSQDKSCRLNTLQPLISLSIFILLPVTESVLLFKAKTAIKIALICHSPENMIKNVFKMQVYNQRIGDRWPTKVNKKVQLESLFLLTNWTRTWIYYSEYVCRRRESLDSLKMINRAEQTLISFCYRTGRHAGFMTLPTIHSMLLHSTGNPNIYFQIPFKASMIFYFDRILSSQINTIIKVIM